MRGQHTGQIEWLLKGLHARHTLGPVALVAGNALHHLRIPGLARGDQHRLMAGIGLQPLARQQFGPAGLAAFLAAQEKQAARQAREGGGCCTHDSEKGFF